MKSLLILLACCQLAHAEAPAAIGKILATEDHTSILQNEEALPEIFDYLLENPQQEDAWKALWKFRKHTDAGLSLQYMRYAHMAVAKNGKVFWQRYLSGNEDALHLLVDAFRHDPTSFGEDVRKANQTLIAILALGDLMAIKHPQFSDERKRNRFANTCLQAHYLEWSSRYADILKKKKE